MSKGKKRSSLGDKRKGIGRKTSKGRCRKENAERENGSKMKKNQKENVESQKQNEDVCTVR